MSRIPEMIDLDAQVEKLTETFGGNTDFENVRGKCGSRFLIVTDARMQNDDGTAMAPSAGVESLKKFLTSFANIKNKIAQLERDEYTLAAHEAREALERPGYRMLGETEPFEEMVPVTLVMFNPHLVLPILTLPKVPDIPDSFINAELPGEVQGDSWRTYWSESQVYMKLSKQKEVFTGKLKKHFADEDIYEEFLRKSSLGKSSVLPHKRGQTQKEQWFKHFFALVFHDVKSNVLRHFSHEEQKHIATWQFYLPKIYARKRTSRIQFGLHLEAEHTYWKKIRLPFCSAESNHGYGAIAYPGEAYHCFDKRSERFKGTRILLSS